MTDSIDTAANEPDENIFLSGPLGGLYVRTAAPIFFIMSMNGLLTVIDAYFLGVYVGADALTAVTLMFPVFMLMVALSTLVGNGMASVLARQLGAGDHENARASFVSAHGLSILVCLALIAIFVAAGTPLIGRFANGSADIAAMGYSYIAILIFCSPLGFFLAVNSDALRCEGRMGFMAAVSLATSIANIIFNYILIVMLDLGVAGSALGTVSAQMLGMLAVVGFRLTADTPLALGKLDLTAWNRRWLEFLALGAPQSLNFLGISLGSASVILSLQLWSSGNSEATIAAYGIITRVMTFIYLPMLGLNMSMQTITGNNFGAGLWSRSDGSLLLALKLSLAYCVIMQLTLFVFRYHVGAVFVDDPATVLEVARIVPIVTVVLFLAGPLMVLAAYFQATGDARRTAILTLPRTYLFAIPLTFTLPILLGETGIWFAGPAADTLMLVLAITVLQQSWKTTGYRFGVLRQSISS